MGMIMHDDVPYGEGTSYTQGTGIAINNNVIAVDADNTPTENSEKPVKSKGVYSAVESNRDESTSLLKSTVGWTGKNLLKNTAVSNTARGITRTVNSDGSITLDGTNSTSGPAVIEVNLGFELEAGTYILSGTPVGAWVNNAGFRLQLYDFINSVQIATDEGSGKTFTLSEKKTLRTRIWFSDGASISNKTFYPMIRDASITDDTYEPYHESVEQSKFDRAEQRVLGAKNIADESNIEVGKAWNGDTNSARARWIIPIEDSYEYIASISGTNSIDYIVYVISPTIIPSTQRPIAVSGFPVKFTPNSGDKYVIFGFNKTNIAKSDVEALKFMLRLASDPDDTYVPYAMTNRELTEEKLSISELKTIASSAADFAAFKTAIANL